MGYKRLGREYEHDVPTLYTRKLTARELRCGLEKTYLKYLRQRDVGVDRVMGLHRV